MLPNPTRTTPSPAAIFAHNLLVARLARDWTQQALALNSDVSRATIAQLEAGTGDPKLSTIQQLAAALGVSPILLLLGKPELDALADLRSRPTDPAPTQAATISTMNHLVSSGFIRSRLEATHLGIALARHARLTNGQDPTAIGAAIGSFHLPGRGTLAAAHFANFLSPTPQIAEAI
jgi:transcriptional regulator with XRE-family HTH domain